MLKWFVNEETALAVVTDEQGGVCQDSCVEFFLTHNDLGTDQYLNFEFNAIGACLNYRCTRPRGWTQSQYSAFEEAPAEALASIERLPSLGREPFEERPMDGEQWTLAVAIPKAVLHISPEKGIHEVQMRANLYKCADNSAKPHWVSAFPVTPPSPDFHRPDCFVALHFERSLAATL